MITDSIEYKDVEEVGELLSSPVDSPARGEGADTTCGLSATTSESSSQHNSWSSRRDSPGGKGGDGLSSYMPIVDEEVGTARNSPRGNTSSEEEQPTSPSALVKAFHKAAYETQVRRWQQVESFYMKHEGWSEHRVILLLQEAFRCSYANLKVARNKGTLSDSIFAVRAAELRNSLATIKREYRRTLERTKERHGDLSSIASKAVTCIASVYPWSSQGFIIGFEENVKYGDLVGVPGSGARHGAPPISPAANTKAPIVVVPSSNTSSVPMWRLEPEGTGRDGDEGDDLSTGLSVVAGGRSRHVATPRVSLRPLPPCCQLFQQSAPPGEGGGSPVVSPARSTTPATASFATVSPQMESLVCGRVASPPPNGQCSPVPVPPPSIAGPLRAGEMRFLEKLQLVIQGMAFVSRSLASTSFIASRRAAIAAATMRQRLDLANLADAEEESGHAQSFSPCTVRPTEAPADRLSSVVPTPMLPTRYIVDASPTATEAAAFDSNPSSFTRHRVAGSVTKRAMARPTVVSINTNDSVNNNISSSNPLACSALSSPVPYNEPMHIAGGNSFSPMPRSYTARTNATSSTVVQSYPHSYAARKIISNSTLKSCNSIVVTSTPPYGTAPCANFAVKVPNPADMPSYGQQRQQQRQTVPVPTDYTGVYASSAMAAVAAARVAPAAVAPASPSPPCYASHVRRDRLRALPVPFLWPYSAVPPVSVEDDRYVKELW